MQLTLYGGFYFGKIRKNMEEYGERAVFLGGYDWIREIPHVQLQTDWGPKC